MTTCMCNPEYTCYACAKLKDAADLQTRGAELSAWYQGGLDLIRAIRAQGTRRPDSMLARVEHQLVEHWRVWAKVA